MSDETPIPPEVQPNTPRTWLRRAWAYAKAAVMAHPDRALFFVLGFAAWGIFWALLGRLL